MKRIFQVLFWSVISAAFIGPGTVTTAASSGTNFGFALLWALLFSTLACLILQEASARIPIISGKNLAQAISSSYIYQSKIIRILILIMVLGAIVLGCAAYETGNILGSIAAIALVTGISPIISTLTIGATAALLLYFAKTKTVARLMGIIVGIMGVTFLITALMIKPPLLLLFKGMLIPSIPQHSGLLILGLIGTTVVPYNLFLGSGIAAGQKLNELRFGLSIAILIGGIISMGVLVVGTSVEESFTFEALSLALSNKVGGWAQYFFAFGLFAAGFTSAITAPLAAAITAKGLFDTANSSKWNENSWRYRGVWITVLMSGIFFGIMNVQPIPAIILAQALNGILLPFIAVFLFYTVNNRHLMHENGINNTIQNVLMMIIIAVAILLGVFALSSAMTRALGIAMISDQHVLLSAAIISVTILIPVTRTVLKKRRY
jgi:Mn2+/Fe2+ NRAMP family transporter